MECDLHDFCVLQTGRIIERGDTAIWNQTTRVNNINTTCNSIGMYVY